MVRTPFPSGESHEDHFKAEGNDDQSYYGGVLGLSQKDKFKEDTEKDSKEKCEKDCPCERNMITVQKGKGHEGADHGHFSLGEVEDLRGFIDDDHGKG